MTDVLLIAFTAISVLCLIGSAVMNHRAGKVLREIEARAAGRR